LGASAAAGRRRRPGAASNCIFSFEFLRFVSGKMRFCLSERKPHGEPVVILRATRSPGNLGRADRAQGSVQPSHTEDLNGIGQVGVQREVEIRGRQIVMDWHRRLLPELTGGDPQPEKPAAMN